MKKTRRIEITAFRRTTLVSGDELGAGSPASPSRQHEVPSSAEALSERDDGFDVIKGLIAAIESGLYSGSDQTVAEPVAGNRDGLTSTPETKSGEETG